MKVFNLFSKRQKALRGEISDVYTYDSIPDPLRVQIVHILRDAIGHNRESETVQNVYRSIRDILCREMGSLKLVNDGRWREPREDLFDFILSCPNVEHVLDAVEISFQAIHDGIRRNLGGISCDTRLSPDETTEELNQRSREHGVGYFVGISHDARLSPDDAIDELNHRFREHGVGYQYESGQIVKVDSQTIHREVVKPVLQLLSDKAYTGANEEFLAAHKHYREGRPEACLVECLKAFESTMKVICAKRKWTYGEDDNAGRLIDTCFRNELIPSFLQSEFSALRAVLESGVPTARNKSGGHGRGTEQREVPEHFAAYVLHMTAASILFLIQSEKNLR